ncbi:hypothetical protein [Pontibacter arcticus]|uniref:SH3 domain-containing protein n=1 Tax=Pontibacter arcticus TaxID=2080288 RepID=A0A364RIA3_9BACT|nr:hypothetical protein [Pontibacter arcticus]RAU84032.1 hypothetical protein DP923_02950 [Pontibacter arcticus]
MRKQLYLILLNALLVATGCQDKNHTSDTAQSINSEKLPDDVIAAVKPLIHGNLYGTPDFEASIIASYDTLQTLYILDASDPLFVKARIKQDSLLTGYIPKVILPDYTRR